MHFFGVLGVLSFLFGLIVTVWLIGEKIYKVNMRLPVRQITDQPLFFLALVALIVGVQLFMAGFLAEMFTMMNMPRNKYLVIEKVGLE